MTDMTSRFVDSMDQLWTGKLQNASSPALREMWRLMAETFQEATRRTLKASALNIGTNWLVLAPEMGSGKTLGTLRYMAMMAESVHSLPQGLKFGAVFVARTIKQCDEAVDWINEHAGTDAAIARHSENNISLQQVSQYPILVVTHAALLKPSENQNPSILEALKNWDGGPARWLLSTRRWRMPSSFTKSPSSPFTLCLQPYRRSYERSIGLRISTLTAFSAT